MHNPLPIFSSSVDAATSGYPDIGLPTNLAFHHVYDGVEQAGVHHGLHSKLGEIDMQMADIDDIDADWSCGKLFL